MRHLFPPSKSLATGCERLRRRLCRWIRRRLCPPEPDPVSEELRRWLTARIDRWTGLMSAAGHGRTADLLETERAEQSVILVQLVRLMAEHAQTNRDPASKPPGDTSGTTGNCYD